MTLVCVVIEHNGGHDIGRFHNQLLCALPLGAAVAYSSCFLGLDRFNECVVLAETKDHLDWELLGKCAKQLDGAQAETLQAAYDEIEDQEDEHLYHTRGWCRELWIQSLGLPAVVPPPEERQKVKTAIGAARAEQAAELQRTATASTDR